MADVPHWFQNKKDAMKDVTRIPTYFYLDWQNKRAVFYYTFDEIKSEDVVRLDIVKLRDNKDSVKLFIDKKFIRMLVKKEKDTDTETSTESEKEKEKEKDTEVVGNKHTMSVLKSHLQKCVRRMNCLLSVKTADWFIKNGYIDELLRRLIIITIEDVILNPNIAVIAWLMMATKSWGFDKKIHVWILGYVKQLAECDVKDNLRYSSQNYEVNDKGLMKELSLLDVDDRSAVVALIVRYSYGGMFGDRKMLLKYIYKWKDRMAKKDAVYQIYKKIPAVKLVMAGELGNDELLLAGFDFHCTSIIRDMQKQVKLKEDELQTLIWNCSSSVNGRKYYYGKKEQSPDDIKMWEKVRPAFEEITGRYRSELKL